MCRILVADDHENTCVTLEAILRNEGHAVTTVLSGQSALEKVQHNQFDIVIIEEATLTSDYINSFACIV